MKRYWRLIPVLFLTLSLIPFRESEARSMQYAQYSAALELIKEVNSFRVEKNLEPYLVNAILMKIAQKQAEYMAETGVVKHFDENGARPYQRAINANYPVAGDLSLGGLFLENVYSGKNPLPKDVIIAWQLDSESLKAMLAPDFKDIGVGVAVNNESTYIVLDSGASRAEAQTASTLSSAIFTPTSGTQSVVVITSTPLEDGAIYHIVQENEALWSIALAYNVSIVELKLLNGLQANNIFIGQKLLIKRSAVITETPEPTITVTFGIPTSTATRAATPTIAFTPTPLPTPPATRERGERIVGAIILVALLGAGVGSWLGAKKNKI